MCSFVLLFELMAVTYDFTITSTDVPGICLVMAQNEDAFTYITEEEDLTALPNGAVPLATHKVGDFISDCGWDMMSCELV